MVIVGNATSHPIDIKDVTAAQDEYDVYAHTLAKMVLKRETTDQMVSYLLAVEADKMGLRTDPVRAKRVVSKLCEFI
ncbi:hypothetical protein [Phyllobacterium lublinensis]|uniref:hypothetical protein n=1 Tax=Phyllobacterium lublinensis TaxID=2875708 RepID=UPI001CCC823C|nr:hypothetical protein [Phyllobacterium sp. 2063]MBZ9654349.1 hypothetical protein [Phyllobacterium sp. 2063]